MTAKILKPLLEGSTASWLLQESLGGAAGQPMLLPNKTDANALTGANTINANNAKTQVNKTEANSAKLSNDFTQTVHTLGPWE